MKWKQRGFPPQKLKLKIEMVSRHFWLRHTGVPGFLHYTPICRRAHGCCAPNFPLYHTFNNLSREKLHKYQVNKNPNFVHSAYCNLGVDVLYYHCQGEGNRPKQALGVRGFRHGRTFTVKAVTVLPFRQTEFLEKISRNPLTNHPMCDTMVVHQTKGIDKIYGKS